MMAGLSQCPDSPLFLPRHLPERSSPSRVRFAAQKPRALDCSGPFRKHMLEKEGKCKVKTMPRLLLCTASRWSAPAIASGRQNSPAPDISLDDVNNFQA